MQLTKLELKSVHQHTRRTLDCTFGVSRGCRASTGTAQENGPNVKCPDSNRHFFMGPSAGSAHGGANRPIDNICHTSRLTQASKSLSAIPAHMCHFYYPLAPSLEEHEAARFMKHSCIFVFCTLSVATLSLLAVCFNGV